VWDILSIVQGWRNGTFANSGLVIKDHSENGGNLTWTFATREYAATGKRPVIKVTYTIPGTWDCSYVATGTCGKVE
jgi:hypothetical protein